jgi:ATP-binding protein involved in chromosome partitioning
VKRYHDIVGDGGSDVLGQARAQRARIDGALATAGRRIAVASGKGGVGKSTLALQIAAALADLGLGVAILDADLNGPTQARLSGVGGVPPIPGAAGLAMPRTASGLGVVSLGSFLPESEPVEFPSVARGESHVWRAAREFALLGELLASVDWGRPDYLVVDLPPGPERTRQYADFLGPGAEFVLVTVPSDVARGVVARSVAALRRAEVRLLGYVENMAGYRCPGCDTIQPLFPESGALDLGVPRLGRVPFDPELARLSDLGRARREDRTGPTFDAIRDVALAIHQAREVPR